MFVDVAERGAPMLVATCSTDERWRRRAEERSGRSVDRRVSFDESACRHTECRDKPSRACPAARQAAIRRAQCRFEGDSLPQGASPADERAEDRLARSSGRVEQRSGT